MAATAKKGFASFLKKAQSMGLGAPRQSDRDGIYVVSDLAFDDTVTDKNGDASVVVHTDDSHKIRLYANSHGRTIAVIAAILRDGGVPMIGYYHEPRESGNGTWLRSYAANEQDRESVRRLEDWFEKRPRASNRLNPQSSNESEAPKADDGEMPF